MRVVSLAVLCTLLVSIPGCVPSETAGLREIDVAFNTAISVGDLSEASRLLDEGADVNFRLNEASAHTTTLILVSGGSPANPNLPDFVTFLLDHGADPNLQNDRGDTALTVAAARGNVPCVAVLLDHGADPAITTRDGNTAVSIAREGGHDEVVQLLESKLAKGSVE